MSHVIDTLVFWQVSEKQPDSLGSDRATLMNLPGMISNRRVSLTANEASSGVVYIMKEILETD